MVRLINLLFSLLLGLRSCCALIKGMHPFIPAKDLAYFESFIESVGLTGNHPPSAPTARGGLRLVTTVKLEL